MKGVEARRKAPLARISIARYTVCPARSDYGLFQNWAGLVLAGESLRVVGGRDGWELAFA
jgi:hypothetical protein